MARYLRNIPIIEKLVLAYSCFITFMGMSIPLVLYHYYLQLYKLQYSIVCKLNKPCFLFEYNKLFSECKSIHTYDFKRYFKIFETATANRLL